MLSGHVLLFGQILHESLLLINNINLNIIEFKKDCVLLLKHTDSQSLSGSILYINIQP